MSWMVPAGTRRIVDLETRTAYLPDIIYSDDDVRDGIRHLFTTSKLPPTPAPTAKPPKSEKCTAC